MHTGMAHQEDWENWTDDEKPVALKVSANKTGTATRSSKGRQSNPKILRLKSRKRQKAQNEKAGIRLVTDVSRFRRGPQHVAQLVKPSNNKFVDASALRALEGSPNSASVGNWAWLKGGQSPASAATPTAPSHHKFSVSPDGSKIVIGMSMPDVVATNPTPTPHQPNNSAWSPDTEDGFSPARYLHLSSNNLGIYPGQQVPPVPAVPSPFKNPTVEKLSRSEIDDDDDFTPVTLFEEDGKSPASAISTKISPATTTRSRSGWWDHVKTPFKERFSPVVGRSEKATASPAVAADEWWKSADEKKTTAMPNQQPFYTGASSSSSTNLHPTTVPVIRVPTPTTTASSSRSSPPPSRQESHSEKARVVLEEHADPSDVPPPYEQTQSSTDKDNKNAQALRYRAVFPPGHPLATQFPPSPMPVSPGLDANMTSRGDMKMSDVPLTPAPTGATAEPALPDSVAGTYVTGEQFRDLEGVSSPAAKVEKTRRRHEKEDYLAHRAGGFWKGRGCLPEDGCYGRSGREGRKRRRVWLGLCLALLLLTILGVVLGVVLSRKLTNDSRPSASGTTGSGDTGSSSSGTSASSVWLNLTDFPPIPTGVATIVGADNSEEVTGCVSPATLWSCSLPPEQQAANEPQEANQPKFIFQIQYDNNTRQLWDIPNGDAPTPDTATAAATSTKSSSSTTSASRTTSTVTVASTSATATSTSEASSSDDEGSDLSRRDDTTLYDTGIAPNPSPPSYDEMWFLGNWTDGIVSDEKAGEPTPFYISFFTSLNGSAGPNMLTSTTTTTTKRGDIGSGSDNGENVTDTLPSPILNADGTGAAAQLRPFPYQQPLRLYDRGLDTEHYGFYSYFNKTIYVNSVDNSTTSSSSSEDGGVLETSATWYATWTQTRFIVKIWTKKTSSGGARLIGTTGSAASSNSSAPGSFPYPVTVGEDTHGGDLSLKSTFAYGVEADQHVNTSEAVSFTNNIGYGSAVVNPRLPDGDLSWGGVDGGMGGCRCEWVNWVEADGTTDGSLG